MNTNIILYLYNTNYKYKGATGSGTRVHARTVRVV